jgi:hypothetical protein
MRTLSILGWVSASLLSSAIAIAGPSRSEREKLAQLVPALSHRQERMDVVLRALVEGLRRPVTIDVCTTYAGEPVTLVTRIPQRLDSLLQALGLQTGAFLRLYIGHHGEVARPTFYCEYGTGTLMTIEPVPAEPTN